MKIAIPLWQNRVAPLMDCCRMLKIFEVDGREIKEIKVFDLTGKSMSERIKILRNLQLNLIICNGISFFYRACLLVNAIKVIPNVIGEENTVLSGFFAKHLKN